MKAQFDVTNILSFCLMKLYKQSNQFFYCFFFQVDCAKKSSVKKANSVPDADLNLPPKNIIWRKPFFFDRPNLLLIEPGASSAHRSHWIVQAPRSRSSQPPHPPPVRRRRLEENVKSLKTRCSKPRRPSLSTWSKYRQRWARRWWAWSSDYRKPRSWRASLRLPASASLPSTTLSSSSF